jgi:hypothetical protein
MIKTEKPHYRYDRPIDGQPEERWWAGLSHAERMRRTIEVKEGIAFRRDVWNATHAPSRQIPRAD